MQFPTLDSPALLSPMSGVTDVAFRALCKRYGAGMTYTEFVSSAALVRESEKTQELLITDPSEQPVGVQLFGANEEEIVKAAKLVEEHFDVIDMNCGCPAHKVIKTGAGSALLNDPEKVGKLVKTVVDAVSKPVTIKIRAGIDEQSINAVEVAKAAEAAGAAAIAVHGRTQKQGYTGLADWDVVKAVKEAVSIPVIGNGDVFSAADFMEKWQYSGCDYIMIARGAIGNPSIFAEINDLIEKMMNSKKNIKNNSNNNLIKELNTNKKNNQKDNRHKDNSKNNDKKDSNKTMNNNLTKELSNNIEDSKKNIKNNIHYFFEYYELAQQYKIPFPQIKGHAMHFTKGMEGGAKLRGAITKTTNAEALLKVMKRVE